MRYVPSLIVLMLASLAAPALLCQQAVSETDIVFNTSPQMWTCAYLEPEILRVSQPRPLVVAQRDTQHTQVLINVGQLNFVDAKSPTTAGKEPQAPITQDAMMRNGSNGKSVCDHSCAHVWGYLRIE